MPPTVQVGTILMKEWPRMTESLGLENEPYSGNWSTVKVLDGFALDRKIHAAGWNFFFMAEEVKATVFGSLAANNIQKALKRIFLKMRKQNFNCLEVTKMVESRSLGVPYITVYAATKSFDLSFAEGLAEEVRQYGIRVCALCHGSTETEFHEVAGQRQHTKRSPETAKKVAHVGLRAMAAGKTVVVSGFSNWLGAEGVRFVPRRLVTRIAGGMFRPGTK